MKRAVNTESAAVAEEMLADGFSISFPELSRPTDINTMQDSAVSGKNCTLTARYLITYTSLRVRNELSTLSPTLTMPGEALKTFSSPFAALGTIKKTIALFGLLNPMNYTDESRIKSGRYKGKTKAAKLFLEGPVISVWRNIDRAIDPSDQIQFYNNELIF